MSKHLRMPNASSDPSPITHIPYEQALVIVGANGSGKSRLGLWIEQNAPTLNSPRHDTRSVRRISANRSTRLNDGAQRAAREDAERSLERGGSGPIMLANSRIAEDGVIGTLDDFLPVLTALFADRDAEAIAMYGSVPTGEPQLMVRKESKLEQLQRLWAVLMPGREIAVEQYRLLARRGGSHEYSATYMSDGERTVLYFIAHALLAPPGVTLLIDEPELHLHESIQTPLWDELEAVRPDVGFIYITHNLAFAASRTRASCAIVKGMEVSGPTWDWQIVPRDTQIPEAIVLTVLGSRRDTIFVEGTAGNLDEELYRAAYPTHFIVPAGKCDSVIQAVQTFRTHASLHRSAVVGIIDLDDRDDVELRALRSQGVLALGVAQVENVFASEPVFRYVATQLTFDESDAKAKLLQATTKLSGILTSQRDLIISKRALHSVKRKFRGASIVSRNDGEFYSGVLSSIITTDATAAYLAAAKLVDDAIASASHAQILRALRNKGAVGVAASVLGVSLDNYRRIATTGVRTSASLRNALMGILPDPSRGAATLE